RGAGICLLPARRRGGWVDVGAGRAASRREQFAGGGRGGGAQLSLQQPLQLLVLLERRVRLLCFQEKPDQLPVPVLIQRIDSHSSPGPVNRLVEVSRFFLGWINSPRSWRNEFSRW